MLDRMLQSKWVLKTETEKTSIVWSDDKGNQQQMTLLTVIDGTVCPMPTEMVTQIIMDHNLALDWNKDWASRQKAR